jgi:hypothetical protein
MKQWLEDGRYGLLEHLRAVRVPLSIVGEDEVRYRPPITEEQHEGWLSFFMAEKNVMWLSEALAGHGLRLYRNCSCGISLVRIQDFDRFQTDQLLQTMDNYRSSLDRLGHPVVELPDLRVPPNIDVTVSELEMLYLIDIMVDKASQVPFDKEGFLKARDLPGDRQELIAHARAMNVSTSPSGFTCART